MIHIYKTIQGFKVTIVDSNFNLVLEKQYKPLNSSIVDLFMVSFNSNNEIVVSGMAEKNKILLIKLSNNGDLIWAKTYSNLLTFALNAMAVNSEDEILIGCLANHQMAGQSYFVLLLNNDGAVINSQRITLSITGFYSMYNATVTDDNDFILSGSGPVVNQAYTVWLLKVNRKGGIDWSKVMYPINIPNPRYGAFGVSIQAIGNDRYLVMGRYGDDYRGSNPSPNEMNGLMIEINSLGSVISSDKMVLNPKIYCNPVDVLYHNGDFYLVGSESYTHLGTGIFLAKYNTQKNQISVKYFRGNMRYPRIEKYNSKILISSYTTINQKYFQYFNLLNISDFDMCEALDISANFLPIQLQEHSHTFRLESNILATDEYFDTIPNGCLYSIITPCKIENNSSYFKVTYESINHIDTTVFLCSDDSIVLYGKKYDAPGVYYDTIFTPSECTKVFKISINNKPLDTTNLTYSICRGDTLNIYGTPIFKEGVYAFEFDNHFGCDSLIFVTLDVHDFTRRTYNYTICPGDSVNIDGTFYKTTLNLQDTLFGQNHCDTIVKYSILVLPYGNRYQSVAICAGDTIRIGNKMYYSTGLYSDTISTPGNCDSIIVTQLSIAEIMPSSLLFWLCDQDSVLINNTYYNSDGEFTFNLKNRAGCDSIVNVKIIKESSNKYFLDTIICEGEIIRLGNLVISSPGIYQLTEKNHKHCDSLIEIHAIKDECYQIYIPNAFSPNQDGVNDEFKIYHTGIATLKIEIFSRWGERLFSSNSINSSWNGTFLNENCMDGVYAYIIQGTFDNGKTFLYKGNISLIR